MSRTRKLTTFLASSTMLAVVFSGMAFSHDSTLFPVANPLQLDLSDTSLELESGVHVPMQSGWFHVPENRDGQGGNVYALPVRVFRTEAANPAPPVFLIAGGPGASRVSGLEDDDRYAEIAFYRQFADVVVYDQRGGGESLPQLECDQSGMLPLDQPLSRAARGRMLAELGAQCRDHWLERGVDLSALNTDASATDLDDLRRALGHERMTLVGGSYATHLILHAARRYPDTIAGIVLAGVEGPDHTWDNPDGVLAALDRIAGEIEASAEYRDQIPEGGLMPALETAQAQLAADPVSVTLRRGEREIEVVIGAEEAQVAMTMRPGSRSRSGLWPRILLSIINEDHAFLAQGGLSMRRVELGDPIHYMMDCASGISDGRREAYAGAAARNLLGDINFEYEYACEPWPVADLGEAFNAPVSYDGPVLVIQGDWDISTPIENALETVTHLPNASMITVRRGGHGAYYQLWDNWTGFPDLLADFVREREIQAPLEYEMEALYPGE